MADPAFGRVRSMTGFGRASRMSAAERIDVDLRSVNNKSLKISLRSSEEGLVPLFEELLKTGLERGSINGQLRIRSLTSEGRFHLDSALLKRVLSQLNELAVEVGSRKVELAEAAALPGIIREEEGEPEELAERWGRVAPAAREALAALVAMREREGAGMALDIAHSCAEIEALAARVAELVPGTVTGFQERLATRIARLLEGSKVEPDPRELAQQVALFAERSDISEELQRLRAHTTETIASLRSGGFIGRKLEFLAQEMHREANTMATKSHGLEIINSVLAIKLHVDRIREQAANVE